MAGSASSAGSSSSMEARGYVLLGFEIVVAAAQGLAERVVRIAVLGLPHDRVLPPRDVGDHPLQPFPLGLAVPSGTVVDVVQLGGQQLTPLLAEHAVGEESRNGIQDRVFLGRSHPRPGAKPPPHRRPHRERRRIAPGHVGKPAPEIRSRRCPFRRRTSRQRSPGRSTRDRALESAWTATTTASASVPPTSTSGPSPSQSRR